MAPGCAAWTVLQVKTALSDIVDLLPLRDIDAARGRGSDGGKAVVQMRRRAS